MSRCAQCGFELGGPVELCPHHHGARDDEWAASNRIMCDFLHRGREPARLPLPARALERGEIEDEPEVVPIEVG